jgi:hypothetical protein
MECTMSKHGRINQSLALQKGMDRKNGRFAALLATAFLLGISAGLARPAAASEMPKISTPQVRVSTGVHVNTVNAHPAISTRSSGPKITGIHQFDKNNGGKTKGGTGNKGAGGTTPTESVQFNYNSLQVR